MGDREREHGHDHNLNVCIDVLVDAKNEYTKQLISILTEPFLNGLISIYDEAKIVCNEGGYTELQQFQILLSNIPKWTQETLEMECERIVEESHCEWLEDLLTAIFVSHTKILTTIRTNNKNRKINLTIPRVDVFIHKVYLEMAHDFWKVPYLLDDLNVTGIAYQKHLQECETRIQVCIENTIRKLVPIQDILKKYITTNEDEEEEETDAIVEEEIPKIEHEEETHGRAVLVGGGGEGDGEEGGEGEKEGGGQEVAKEMVTTAFEPEQSSFIPPSTPISQNSQNLQLVIDPIPNNNTTTDLSPINLSPIHNSSMEGGNHHENGVSDLSYLLSPTSSNASSSSALSTPTSMSSNFNTPSMFQTSSSIQSDINLDNLPVVNVDFGGGSSNEGGSSGITFDSVPAQHQQIQADVLKEIDDFHAKNTSLSPPQTPMSVKNFSFLET